MKLKQLFLSCVFLVAVLCASICLVFAKAPTTAKIAFASTREETMDIYLMNPDGSDRVNITNHSANDVNPVWSPTGEQILFASDRDRFPLSWDLYLMDPDGANVRRVFGKSARRSSPTWSPDGKRIAYTYGEIGNTLLYIGTIDGKDEERVAIGYSPAWSPDGTEIIFGSGALNKPRRFSLLKVRTKRQTFFPFPKEPKWVRYPAWSPLGDKLAFSWYNRVEVRRADIALETLYIVNRDGTGLQQIVEEGKRAVRPVWSPRGDELLYAGMNAANKGSLIYKIALAGGKPVLLTDPKFWSTRGDWFDPAFALPISPQPQLLTTIWGELKRE